MLNSVFGLKVLPNLRRGRSNPEKTAWSNRQPDYIREPVSLKAVFG